MGVVLDSLDFEPAALIDAAGASNVKTALFCALLLCESLF